MISNASQNQESQAEEAAQVLERFVDGTSHTNADPSDVHEPTSSLVGPGYPNMYWLGINNSLRQDEKFVLLQEIISAMPELDMVRHLYEVFVTRCQGPIGNVVHTPTFMKQAEKLCECFDFASQEAQAIALSSTISMDTLACHLLAVRMPRYRASSVCSYSLSDSLYSPSPFIPHHLYLAGLRHLWLFVWKSFERQMSISEHGGRSPCVASKEGCHYFAVRLPVYKLPSCFCSMVKKDR